MTPARRDGGLRRLRTLNRILVASAVAATGLLTDVAARAFPGHTRKVATTTPATQIAPVTARRSHVRPRRSGGHHPRAAHPRLTAPAQPPTTSAAPSATSPVPAPSAGPAPQADPNPAPVVSGGS